MSVRGVTISLTFPSRRSIVRRYNRTGLLRLSTQNAPSLLTDRLTIPPYLKHIKDSSMSTTSGNAGSSGRPKSSYELAREQRKWNNLSEKMSSFHEWFKQEFNTLYELADGSFTSRGLSLPRYLEMAKALSNHLTMHHNIEERHVFPILAKYMPQFGTGADEVHIKSHRGIHDGLEQLDKLVAKWRVSPSTYSPVEMKSCLDGFRDVLFHHLDEEVEDLRADNLKKYMTLEQVETIPI